MNSINFIKILQVNSDCTVYEYGNMKFAADFKVRDKFVDQEENSLMRRED